MLTVHHLGRSQSERIVWLCEELGVPYEMKRHDRDPVTNLAPPELRAMTTMGTAPVITDGDLVMGESGAIIDYIIGKHGGGRLAPAPGDPHFAEYVFWYHFANATFQPLMSRNFLLQRLKLPEDNAVLVWTKARLAQGMDAIETHVSGTEYLAGEFTAADIMLVFSLTTMRFFYPLDLAPYPKTRAYLQRIGARDAYRRAMAKGDPEFAPLLA